MRVLLVEDHPADVHLIRLAFQESEAPVELLVAEDGVKALEFLKARGGAPGAQRPDVVLLDLKLPRKNGLEVLAEIKRDPELRRIPVIVLTSSNAPGDVERAYSLQAAAYLTKPLSGMDDLVKSILSFLRNARFSGPAVETTSPGPRVPRQATVVRPALPLASESFGELTREVQLAALVDSSHDPIIGIGLDGVVLTWNRAAEDLYGYTAEEAIGQSIDLILPGEGLFDLAAALSVLRRGGQVESFDTKRQDRRGRPIEVSSSVSPVYDAGGDIVAVSLIARDITARKVAEERFRIAIENSPNAIAMVDAQGVIILVNAETERLFGYRRDELVGRPIEILVPQRYGAQHPQLRAGFLAHPEKRPMGAGRELYGLRKDGQEFPVEIGLTPIHSGQGLLVMSSIVDITERKRAQEVLAEQTVELARSNAELEQFAYVASHDLQEPLRTVTSYTELLERRYADRLDDEASTFLRYAREGAVRMQGLLEALLAYSRVGTRREEPVPTELGGVLTTALKNLKAAIDAADAEIVYGDLPTVAADPTQLAELFQNLISNALKFHGKERPRVEIAVRRHNEGWRVSVIDNGIGIDAQYFDRIFQVFQRLHAGDQYPGTGIGLAISKRIVEHLGGTIWVESEPGRGSTFHFTLPEPSAAVAAVR